MDTLNASELRAWLRDICRRESITVSQIARRAGKAPSTLTRFMSGETDRLNQVTVAAIELAFHGTGSSHARPIQVREDAAGFDAQTTIAVSVPAGLLAIAREYRLDVESLLAQGGVPALEAEARREFRERNRDVIEWNRRHIEEHGTLSQRFGMI